MFTTLPQGMASVLLDALPDALILVDGAGEIVFVNQQAEELFGYAELELVGQSVELLIPERFRPSHRDHHHRYLSNPIRRIASKGLDLKARRRDGTEIPVDINLNPVRTDTGLVIAAVVRDISVHKVVERALRASEERYRGLAEASRDQIYIIDRERIVEYVNPCAADVFDTTPEHLIGQHVADLFPPETAARQAANLERVFATGQPLHREGLSAFPGRQVWLDTWLVPLYEQAGHVRAVLGVSRDITERKELEQRLVQAQRMEAIGQLAGGIAHDFNNLLTIFQGYSQLVLAQIDPDKPIWGDLREIQKAAERAAVLTHQLLAFSRRQVLQLAVLDLNALVQETQGMLERLIGEDIAIESCLAPDLGRIEADPARLQQILLNLASNARDAMPNGGRLVIETHNTEIKAGDDHQRGMMPPGKYVTLRVTDTGVGMDEATKARVFEPFFTTKSMGKGTGLGLSSVYGTVKQLNGYIWVDSEAGKGTTFALYFPETSAPLTQTARPGAPDVPPVGMEAVLLVEDDEGVRKLAAQALKRHGYAVHEAGSPTEALGLANEHPDAIDIVVSDLVLPEISGRELVARLKTHFPRAGVLYMSGYSQETLQEHGKLDADLLTKPFEANDLLRRVRQILDRSRNR